MRKTIFTLVVLALMAAQTGIAQQHLVYPRTGYSNAGYLHNDICLSVNDGKNVELTTSAKDGNFDERYVEFLSTDIALNLASSSTYELVNPNNYYALRIDDNDASQKPHVAFHAGVYALNTTFQSFGLLVKTQFAGMDWAVAVPNTPFTRVLEHTQTGEIFVTGSNHLHMFDQNGNPIGRYTFNIPGYSIRFQDMVEVPGTGEIMLLGQSFGTQGYLWVIRFEPYSNTVSWVRRITDVANYRPYITLLPNSDISLLTYEVPNQPNSISQRYVFLTDNGDIYSYLAGPYQPNYKKPTTIDIGGGTFWVHLPGSYHNVFEGDFSGNLFPAERWQNVLIYSNVEADGNTAYISNGYNLGPFDNATSAYNYQYGMVAPEEVCRTQMQLQPLTPYPFPQEVLFNFTPPFSNFSVVYPEFDRVDNHYMLHCSDAKQAWTTDLQPGHDINVFPNPANTYLNIQADGNLEMLTLTDATGREVYRSSGEGFQFTIPTADLAEGMYLLQIQRDGKSETRRISIAH